MRNVAGRITIVVLFIAWLTAVLISFYAVQKPFDLAQAQAIAHAGWNIVVALLVLGAATRLGLWIMRFFSLPALSLGERCLLSAAVGLGALAILSLLPGAAGWLHPVIISVTLLGLSFALLPERGELCAVGRAAAREWATWPRSMQAFLVITWGLALLLTLAPPISFDALLYHLAVPKLYAMAGRIGPGIDIAPAYYPTLMETLFLDALVLRAEVATKLIHFGYGLLLTMAVYLAAAHYWGRRVARYAVLLLLSMPMVPLLATWAYNDLALASYSFLALYALARWREDAGDWWAVSAVMAALAMSLKYTAFTVPLTLALFILIWYRRTRRFAVMSTARLGVLSGLVALPWYVKSWALSDNPFYPFVFGGTFWDSFRAAAFRQPGTGIGWNPQAILTLPWVATLGYRDATLWGGRIGPLILALLPAVVILRSLPRAPSRYERGQQFLDLLLVFAVLSFTVWTLGVVQSALLWQARLLLPALVPLAIVSAWTLQQLGQLDLPAFSLQRFLMMAIALVLGLQVISQTVFLLNNNPLLVIVGMETRDHYLERNLGTHYRAMEAIGRQTPENAHVLFLYEPRSYYSPRPTQPDALLDKFRHELYRYRTPEQIADRWRAEGYTHVLIAWWGVRFLEEDISGRQDSATRTALDTVVRDDLRPIYRDESGDYALYEINAGQPE